VAERTTPGIRTALSIAGSDSSGGAGIQADLKTFAILGVYGATAITAITAQNTRGVQASHVLDPELIEQQIESVASDLKLNAVKTGMLATGDVIRAVARAVKRNNLVPLVVDPVMVAKNGDVLIDEAAIAVMRDKLLPHALIVTPNRYEAARLLGKTEPIKDLHGARAAAPEICKRTKAKTCIIKGIAREGEGDGQMIDVFFDGSEVHEIVTARLKSKNTHGSGCTFSAAITGALALGQELPEAVQTARAFVSEAIRQATDIGGGISPVNHLAYAKVSK
jgi:hydroxymethylpyrimidine/phosphomethylpyrimidine kinase